MIDRGRSIARIVNDPITAKRRPHEWRILIGEAGDMQFSGFTEVIDLASGPAISEPGAPRVGGEAPKPP